MTNTSLTLYYVRDAMASLAVLVVVVLATFVTLLEARVLPASLVSSVIVTQSAQAATWEARVGRLHWNGNPYPGAQVWWCDPGYWLTSNYLAVDNTNNTIWYNCVTGAW